MNLPKFNSADGRCYWMKPEVQEELQPLFDQCIQDAIDGRITRLDSLWPPVVVSSQGAPFEVWQLLRAWTEIQRAETLDAEKAIAFSENLRRQSRWGEIDHHLLDMLKRELQEKYFVVTGDEDDRFWDREYSLKPGIRAEEVPEPLLRFACYVAVSYKVYGLDFQYLDANYLFGLVEKVRPDMVKKLKEHGTGRLPISLHGYLVSGNTPDPRSDHLHRLLQQNTSLVAPVSAYQVNGGQFHPTGSGGAGFR